jgi:hypothetical protein
MPQNVPALLSVRVWLSEHKLFVAALVVVVLMAFYSAGLHRLYDQVTASHERLGVLESLHHRQWFTGAQDPLFYVRLATGELVLVDPPPGTPFIKGAPVTVMEREFASGRRNYTFIAYTKAAPNSTLHRPRA